MSPSEDLATNQESKQELIIIRDKEGLKNLKKVLEAFDYIAYDVETTGVAEDSEIIGFSVSGDISKGYYVVTKYWDTEKKQVVSTEADDKELIVKFLKFLQTKNLVMHNAIFDCKMTNNNYGVELIEAVHTDTMILAHVIDENRSLGLKELAKQEFGESSAEEQVKMKQSVTANGGQLTKLHYELYKADSQLLAEYGAKDAILTMKIFYLYVPELFEQNLNEFFYEEESMPLLKGPTYALNTNGLKVDVQKLTQLGKDLREECDRLKQEVITSITPYIKDKYPGTSIKNTFNINSNQQLSWLLFIKLKNDYHKLTKKGRELAKDFLGKVPYNPSGKIEFLNQCETRNLLAEKYIQCDTKVLLTLAGKYKWIAKLIDHKKAEKLLKTYVNGISEKVKYGIIRPSFLQHGTTGGRYSSKQPNFQNLPRDDKRVKSCIVARPGKVFIAADYSQLEPRVFASLSQDISLLKCFEKNEDFYSVIGIPVFNKPECSANKNDKNWFGKHERLRLNSKVIALSITYGTTPYKMSDTLRDDEGQLLDIDHCREIQASYFHNFPSVKKMIDKAHKEAKVNGAVYSLFGRPRRIPDAKLIKVLYPNTTHNELPYEQRSLLNLAVNHQIQASAASIINRAAIALTKRIKQAKIEAKIVLQVHDELIVECAEELKDEVAAMIKDCMENTTSLPGVSLIAEPKIGKNLAECK